MDFDALRRKMIDSQLRTNKVTDPAVLAAMAELPRESFVPKAKEALCYADDCVECDEGRSLMAPMILARMIQEAAVGPEDIVLCVGAGPGYSTAVLAKGAEAVFALESSPEGAAELSNTLAGLKVDNAVVVEGDLALGWPGEGPYDVILFDGAVPDIPQALFDQLADGGRMVAVIKGEDGVGRATFCGKRGQSIAQRCFLDVNTATLPEFEKPQGFVF